LQPISLRVAYDTGWSDGDPGNGRLRFDNARISKARHLFINARDAQDALLSELVPAWRTGDVVVIERPGAEANRVVAWIIGDIVHRGSYWRVPISVRSVYGAFAAHDELVLHHATNSVDADEPAVMAAPPSIPDFAHAARQQEPAYHVEKVVRSEPAPHTTPPPIPSVPTHADVTHYETRIAELERDNQSWQQIVERLVADDTELYVVEGQR
jgi:hypothetical protein